MYFKLSLCFLHVAGVQRLKVWLSFRIREGVHEGHVSETTELGAGQSRAP